ncbi:MAG: glycosyltransferase family 4 protein [Fischerella sp.]|nr:glycosyltransferase family 4 protein [Fischerella sp.]
MLTIRRRNMENLRSVFLPYNPNNNENPYQSQLAKNLEKLGVEVKDSGCGSFFLPIAITKWQANILHLHWLHFFLIKSNISLSLISSILFIFQILFLRLLGVKIIWTVHNLKNHANRFLKLEKFFTVLVAKIAHAIIAHCEVAKQEIITNFHLSNDNKIFVVPHGNYIDYYENILTQAKARENLNISSSDVVFLFLGLIRPYKGVLELIDVFKHLPQPNIQLVIAGKVWNNDLTLADLIKQRIADDRRIKFIPGFVADDQIQLYMNASDVVVFPYRDILTSGAVLLAMSFGRACIAPRKGCIGEVLDDAGAILYDPDDEDSLLNALKMAIEKQFELSKMGEYNYQIAKEYNWQNIAEKTLKVYQNNLQYQ